MGRSQSTGKENTLREDMVRVVALAGNPNVGKSSLFNGLTGLHQHTGNWPGKTVASAEGMAQSALHSYRLVDLPGTYSLLAHSAEEEVARNFLCFGRANATIIVCDATCLERNLNLVLQTLEISPRALVCVNLLDEAKRKNIHIDLEGLSVKLGVPVIGTIARDQRTLQRLLSAVEHLIDSPEAPRAIRPRYPKAIEEAIKLLEPAVARAVEGQIPSRWLSLRLLELEPSLLPALSDFLGRDLLADQEVFEALERARVHLAQQGLDARRLSDCIASSLVLHAEDLCLGIVSCTPEQCHARDRKIDQVLTSRWAGYPLMLLLLAGIFWLTITGANLPSALLGDFLFGLEQPLAALLTALSAPTWLCEMLTQGVWRVLAWVVSVMLPPMAIFFPLFTLLEDVGYLPRIAYNLDAAFRRCKTCGKQALTMCMGFGCNAAGVIGCRIIDSPRERLIAMLTNSFVPCNGRFPTMIALITIFFAGGGQGIASSLVAAGLLTGVILLGVGCTLFSSRLLSSTALKGLPSSFALELPPYRCPQVGRVLLRSVFDRTLFVLGRAVAVAAPAGLLIWCMANCTIGEQSLLAYCAGLLDPFARLLGLDGVILLAFFLGLPANEIVLPIIIMSYLAEGSLTQLHSLSALRELLVQNGWTAVTALCTILFSLLHWPCSTTLWTIQKESGSVKWTVLSLLLPTVFGMLACFTVATVARVFG